MALEDRRHPDAERLAEYADGVLDAEARAAVEQHLADCAECRAIVMETMAFLDGNPAIAATTRPRVIPFATRRRLTAAAVGLAAAAALVLAIRVAQPDWASGLFGPRGDRPELQELIAAVAGEPTRPVEGRLTGGFKYAPPPSPTRGAGDREVSPDVRIAAARIEQIVRADDSSANRAALGIALLAVGDSGRAIEALEAAAQREPGNAQWQSDLAAAYLARAGRLGRVEDLQRALDSADRAIKAQPALAEAWFNRALVLERSGRADEAARAWLDAAGHQDEPRWREEAHARASALTKPTT